VAGRIRASLERLARIEYSFIYGSFAKGEEKADSDVDMNLLNSNLGKLEKMMGREEFKSKRKAKDGFLMDVLSGEKIMLVGAENGL
jgi:predicted nucleotidyltransferase